MNVLQNCGLTFAPFTMYQDHDTRRILPLGKRLCDPLGKGKALEFVQ